MPRVHQFVYLHRPCANERVVCSAPEILVRLGPKVATSNLSELSKCRDRLKAWYQNLTHDLRYETTDLGIDYMDIDAILLYRALLISLFFTTTTAFYRPLALHERVSMMKCSISNAWLQGVFQTQRATQRQFTTAWTSTILPGFSQTRASLASYLRLWHT